MSKFDMKANMYERVTAAMIDMLEKREALGKWEMPWHRTGSDRLPYNVVTNKEYRGMNTVLLWGQMRGAIWGTYKQWQSINAQVRKGERGTLCVKWKMFKFKDKLTGEEKERLVPLPFTVFASDQVDGYIAPDPIKVEDLTKRLKAVDKVVAQTKIEVKHGGGRAYFDIRGNYVQMPKRETFKATKTGSAATENYYSTLFHELTHATGHESRLARKFGVSFGNQDYAFEELIAEIGAAFACARLAITNEPRQDHGQYLASWIKKLKDDDRAIFKAASQAQKACDWLIPPLVTEEMKEAA